MSKRERVRDMAFCLDIGIIRQNYKLSELFRLFRVRLPVKELDDERKRKANSGIAAIHSFMHFV